MELHASMVFRIAYSTLRNHQDAEDAAQECFLRVLKAQRRLNQVRNTKTWLAIFPTPVALSEQEKLMFSYLANTPREEVVAQIQSNDQEEGNAFWETVSDQHRVPSAQEILDKEISMKKFFMLFMLFLAAVPLTAQEAAKKGQEPSAKKEPREVAKQAALPTYRLAFSIYELQEGKKINQRDYSLLAQADDRGGNKLKVGTRVPIDVGSGNVTYADVGFDMECLAAETVNNKLAVRVDMTLTNFAIPEQNTDPRTAGSRPVLRGVTQRVRTILTPGKPQVISSMDDVNSNKRMQVELTATKVE